MEINNCRKSRIRKESDHGNFSSRRSRIYRQPHMCELLERGYEVVVVDNLYNSSEVALERVQEITGKTLKFYKGDILNREDLEPIFENEEIEAVIHFAGLKAVGESVHKPLEYYNNNITRNFDPL